jgi:hypothetical protein
MFRFLSRFLGVWLVAAALVAATVDGAKSIAASSLVLTPFGETWGALAAMAQGGAEGSARPPCRGLSMSRWPGFCQRQRLRSWLR